MEPQTIARIHALGRVAVGAALCFVPARAGAGWIGRDGQRRSVQALTSALGIRDLAIGAGAASALFDGGDVHRWIRAGVASDAVDLVATLRARDDIPGTAVLGVAVVATGSAALGAWLHARL